MTIFLLVLTWVLTVLCVSLLLRVNRLSRTPSRTPSTTPTPTSDTSTILEIFKMAMTTVREQAAETRALVVDMTQGRESQRRSGDEETTPIGTAMPSTFDVDWMPAPPGVEEIFERESEEDQQYLLMKERVERQGRIRDLTEQAARLQADSEDSSPGPWQQETPGNDPTSSFTGTSPSSEPERPEP